MLPTLLHLLLAELNTSLGLFVSLVHHLGDRKGVTLVTQRPKARWGGYLRLKGNLSPQFLQALLVKYGDPTAFGSDYPLACELPQGQIDLLAACPDQVGQDPLGEREVDQQALLAVHPVPLPQLQKPLDQSFPDAPVSQVSQPPEQHVSVPRKPTGHLHGKLGLAL